MSDEAARDTAGGEAAMRGDDPLRETLVASEVLRRSRILEFRVDTIETPDGRRSTRDIAAHPGAVAMVAIDGEDRVLMVRQWRHATGGPLLEIPAGTLDRLPNGTIEHHGDAARRELEEETGARAAHWRHLGSFYTAPGFTSELMHLYLATGLTTTHEDGLHPDEDERLELTPVPFEEALAMAMRGDVHDAKSMVGILMAARIRESEADA